MDTDITVRYELYSHDEMSAENCLSYCKLLTKDYIWQKEFFDLVPSDHVSSLSCLYGTTNVGENIIDEWIIVFLLFELTKKYSNIVAHVSDDDGEFLLIQAAEHLPSWLNPESSENRIFISHGSLHIIPSLTTSDESSIMSFPTTPTIVEAYDALMSSFITNGKDEIQDVIQQKIVDYPHRITEHIHYAHCYVPYEIAFILRRNPQFVSTAVQAFYERDPIDVNICQNLKIFKPQNRMMTLVKFSKHLYGQLYQANFHPSKESKWKLPNPNATNYKTECLGYKLTCGFELLIGRCSNADKRETLGLSGRSWEQYLTNLKKYNFFMDEKEGSKKYQALFKQAKEHFLETFSSTKNSEIEEEIAKLYQEALTFNQEKELYTKIATEDSDDWLTVSPEKFDQLMMNMYTTGPKAKDNLLDLSSKVKGFVDNVSSYEGVESFYNTTDNDEILFDQDKFMSCLDRLINSPEDVLGGQDSSDDDDDCNEFLSCYKEDEGDENELSNIFERLDTELKESTLNINGGDKEGAPLDIDINVFQNFFESFSSQTGLSGPVSSILHSMGKCSPDDS